MRYAATLAAVNDLALSRPVDPGALHFGPLGLGGAMPAEASARFLAATMEPLVLPDDVDPGVRSQFEKLKRLFATGFFATRGSPRLSASPIGSSKWLSRPAFWGTTKGGSQSTSLACPISVRSHHLTTCSRCLANATVPRCCCEAIHDSTDRC